MPNPTFKYTTYHFPTDQSFEQTCECLNERMFAAWLNTWNRMGGKTWKYSSPIMTNGDDFHPTNCRDVPKVASPVPSNG